MRSKVPNRIDPLSHIEQMSELKHRFPNNEIILSGQAQACHSFCVISEALTPPHNSGDLRGFMRDFFQSLKFRILTPIYYTKFAMAT